VQRTAVTKAILLYRVPLGCGGLWNAYGIAFVNLELLLVLIEHCSVLDKIVALLNIILNSNIVSLRL